MSTLVQRQKVEKRFVRSGIRTHAHICGPEHSLRYNVCREGYPLSLAP